MLLQNAVAVLTEHPELAFVLALILRAGLAWQGELTWYEYRTLHGLKRLLFPVLDRRLTFVSFVNPKGGRDDPEFLRTLDYSPAYVVGTLRQAGGSLHLINALKKRPASPLMGDSLTAAHVVFTHDDGMQSEAYLFDNGDGTTDVYVHVETSVTDPVGHLTDAQTDGDARDVVADALPEV